MACNHESLDEIVKQIVLIICGVNKVVTKPHTIQSTIICGVFPFIESTLVFLTHLMVFQ